MHSNNEFYRIERNEEEKYIANEKCIKLTFYTHYIISLQVLKKKNADVNAIFNPIIKMYFFKDL